MSSEVPFISCAGTPHECGFAHGTALRSRIRDTLTRWLNGGGSEALDLSVAHPTSDRLLSSTSHLEAISRYTPWLLPEMNGIAAGAGVAVKHVQAFCLMDEEWAARLSGYGPGCTVVCCLSGKTALMAQTMDLPVYYSRAYSHEGERPQAVLEIQPRDGRRHSTVFTCAGMLGLLGSNADGLTVCLNNLSTLSSSRSGLPVMAVLRSLLHNCGDVAAAAAHIRSVQHATGQAYTIGDADGNLVCFEASSTGVFDVPVAISRQEGWARANHPLVHSISGLIHSSEAERAYARLASRERQACASAAVVGADSLEALEAALSTPPVAVSYKDALARDVGCTFAGVSFVCGRRSGTQRMRVVCGEPRQHEAEHGFQDVIHDWPLEEA